MTIILGYMLWRVLEHEIYRLAEISLMLVLSGREDLNA
jgi:hypothetical protein